MLSFEKLTCFPDSSPGGSRLCLLCSLVPLLYGAGCLLLPKAGRCINYARIPETPYLLTVLQPPTQGLVGGDGRGGKECLDSMKPVFGMQHRPW